MDETSRDVTPLIDSDTSSDSIVEVLSSAEGIVTIAISNNETSNDGPNSDNATSAANTSNNNTESNGSVQDINHNCNIQKNQYEKSSDIPSLVDASDAEDSQSNASESTTRKPFEEATKEEQDDDDDDDDDDGNKHQSCELTQGNKANEDVTKPWDEGVSEMVNQDEQSNIEVIVSNDISSESATSLNTVKTSNNQGTQQDTPIINRETHNAVVVACKHHRHSSIFEKYISYVTEFFSCSSSTICNPSNACLNCMSDGNIMQFQTTTTVSDSDSDPNQQLKILQTCIEIDILNLMGCSAEGAQYLIDTLGNSFFCNECQCTNQASSNNKHGILDACQQCNHSNISASDEDRPKIRNRNVYVRQKAINRIHRLRQGGLSRHFSLAPVSRFIGEELNSLDTNGTSEVICPSLLVEEAQTQRKARKGSLIPLSKRPKSLSDCTRQTSLASHTEISHESVIFATRSDYCMSTDDEDNDEINKRRTGEKQQVKMTTVFGSLLNSEILNGILPKSCLRENFPLNSHNKTETSDLYYDSDPGTHYGRPSFDQSKLRKAVFNNNSRRSRTVGLVDEVTDLQRFEMELATNRNGLIASLDIPTFNVNDNYAMSLLMEELITSSFSFIWHPNKALKTDNHGSTCTSSVGHGTPHRVKAWFEMGSCLKKALIQPKFVWRYNDSVKYGSRLSKMKSIQKPEFVELLNIVRIITPSKNVREDHPFVKLDCAFMIVTNTDEEVLFETATTDERDKFLFAFKLIVARLASKIIVGDKNVFDEFFTPGYGRKKRKKRRKRHVRSKKSSSSSVASGSSGSVMMMRGIKEEEEHGGGSCDSYSVVSETSSFSKAIIGTVQEEGNRTDELWGATI